MSASLLVAVERTALRPTIKTVLLSMVGMVGKDRIPQCWASVATIAARAAVSERTVQRVLRYLEAGGFISLDREAEHYSTRRWRINLGAIVGAWRPRPEKAGNKSGKAGKSRTGIIPTEVAEVRGDRLSPLGVVRGDRLAPEVTTTNVRSSFRNEQASTTSTPPRQKAAEGGIARKKSFSDSPPTQAFATHCSVLIADLLAASEMAR